MKICRGVILIPQLIMLLISTNCSLNVELDQKENTITIDLNKAKEYSYKDLFSRIELIPLETNEESVISEGITAKTVFSQDAYFIQDRQQDIIAVFDKNGKYQYKIDRRGEGPEEYLGISDFEINQFTQQLEILQANGLIYTYSTKGKFLSKIELPASLQAVHYFKNITKDLIILYSKFNQERVLLFSRSENKIIKKLIDIPVFVAREAMMTPPRNPFYLYGQTVLFHEFTSNDIYSVEVDSLISYYSWDFGKSNFNVNKLPLDKTRKYYQEIFKSKKWAHRLTGNVENKDFRIVNFMVQNKPMSVFFNKNSGEYRLIDGTLKEKVKFPWMYDFLEDGSGVYVLLEPQYLQACITAEMLDEENQERLKMIEDTDNPVLIKYYF